MTIMEKFNWKEGLLTVLIFTSAFIISGEMRKQGAIYSQFIEPSFAL